MTERFKENILASSEAVRCSQSAQSTITIALLLSSTDYSKKLSEKIYLAVLIPAYDVFACNFLKISKNPLTATSLSYEKAWWMGKYDRKKII